ncbi:MAG TPA: extracellular solute-binding protein [Caldilineaceae bacterium]|nr:extracellular solute-binding protein [Caldilineaceae bacterium]
MASSLSRRRFLQMSGFVTAAGVLAACAAPVAAPQGSGGEAAAPSGGKVHLKWDTFRGPGTGWNEERIESFVKDHPNIEIEFRPLTGATQQDNYGKMYAQFAAGDLGDICAFDPSHFHFWRAINGNIICPIDDLVAADNTDLKQWFDQFMELQRYQGQLFGLPSWGWAGFDSFVINAVHFEEAGIELPDPTGHDTSMATYAEWAHQLHQEGSDRFSLNLTWGEEGTKSLLLDDAGSQEGLRWAYKLSVEDKILPAQASFENIDSAVAEGKVSMNWAGSLNVRNVKRAIQDETVAKAHQGLLPTDKNGKFPSQIRGGTWNILKQSAHPTEAFEFIKHITNTEGSFSFNLVAGQGAFVRPDVVDLLIKEDPVHEWFIPNLENGIKAHAPANSRGREYTDAVTQWMTLMMDPNQPVPFEQGLEDLHTNIQMVLDMPAAA